MFIDLPPNAEPLRLEDILLTPMSPDELKCTLARRLERQASVMAKGVRDWAARNPAWPQTVLAKADLAMQGLHQFQGTGGRAVFVGDPVQWRENPSGDPDFISMFNRMPHWRPLLYAWILTGKAAYATKVVAELEGWLDQNPPPAIQPEAIGRYRVQVPWRQLEMGIRMSESWPVALLILAETDLLSAELLARMVASMDWHGRVLSEISPLMHPEAEGNWFTFEMDGLLTLAAMLPELKQSKAWLALAWHHLERNAAISLTTEGGQEEGAPHYHNSCVSQFSHSAHVARQNGVQPSEQFETLLRNAALYSLHACRPNGTNVPWADSDASTTPISAILGATLALDFWEPLATLKCFVPIDVILSCADELYFAESEPDVWLDKVKATPAAPSDLVLWAKSLDQAMVRTDWSAGASSLFFGCRTPTKYGHAHIDPAAFDFCLGGRPILVDPGRFIYDEVPERRMFKSATFHNTITINDREPFEYVSSFALGPQRDGRLIKGYNTENFTAFESQQDNFAPVLHQRAVVLMRNGALVVLDALHGLEVTDTVQLWYHFDSTNLRWDEPAGTVFTQDSGLANVALTVSSGLSGTMMDGFVSDLMDQRRPSQRMRFESTGGPSIRLFATLVQPIDAFVPGSAIEISHKSGPGEWEILLPNKEQSYLGWIPGSILQEKP